jgi:transcriptional regulator with XRE-family HTH domain
MSKTKKELTKIEKYLIKKVKEKRKALGMSQLALAHELDVSEGFIGQVESPNFMTHYNLNHLNAIAKIFKCDIYDLLPQKPL